MFNVTFNLFSSQRALSIVLSLMFCVLFRLATHVEQTKGPEAAKELKTKLNELFTKKVIPNLKNYDFYSGGKWFS